MELNKSEFAEISQIDTSLNESARQLDELALAYVGGGIGDAILG